MPTMKVVQVPAARGNFELVERAIPEPRSGEVLIKVAACGVCRGDVVVKEGTFPNLVYPRVPGHEVVGTIVKLGGDAVPWKEGQRVGIGWHGGHCFHCDPCRHGEFGACETALTTGLSIDGGYAEYMIGRVEALLRIPEGIDSAKAAPLVCAGNTTFGTLRNSGAQPGDLVAIHGLGGLGHLGLQYARKMGFRTAVLSRGKDKEALARKLGADSYIDTNGDPAAELCKLGGARVILGTAPDAKAIAGLIGGLGRHGRLLMIAYTGDVLHIPAQALLYGERSIAGAVGGNYVEEAIRFSQLMQIEPMIETFPLERAADAYDAMLTSRVHFRAVITMGH
jgi:D-arabinose 1-dehydrogenase-like Zn-dependent alcohol dehydrogenase